MQRFSLNVKPITQIYIKNILKICENLQFLTKIKIKQPSSFFFTVAGA